MSQTFTVGLCDCLGHPRTWIYGAVPCVGVSSLASKGLGESFLENFCLACLGFSPVQAYAIRRQSVHKYNIGEGVTRSLLYSTLFLPLSLCQLHNDRLARTGGVIIYTAPKTKDPESYTQLDDDNDGHD